MIAAIPTTGEEINSQLDLRFGRAKYILLYNTEDKTVRTIQNQVNLNAAQGAGIQTAQTIVDANADVLITGNLGPKAFRVLDAGGIKSYLSSASSAEVAINDYEQDKLELATAPNVEGHWT